MVNVPKVPQNLLLGQEVSQAQAVQGDPVQGRQGLSNRTGQASLRQKAVRIRGSDQARLPQEGQDHQKSGTEAGVHQVQGEEAAAVEEVQALRAGRRQEEEGTDDTVLSLEFLI